MKKNFFSIILENELLDFKINNKNIIINIYLYIYINI